MPCGLTATALAVLLHGQQCSLLVFILHCCRECCWLPVGSSNLPGNYSWGGGDGGTSFLLIQKPRISSAPLHSPQSKHDLNPSLKVYCAKYKQLYEALELTLQQGLKRRENLPKLFCYLQLAWWLNRNSTSALLFLNSWTEVTSCFSEKCLAVTKASMTLGHLPLFPFTSIETLVTLPHAELL